LCFSPFDPRYKIRTDFAHGLPTVTLPLCKNKEGELEDSGSVPRVQLGITFVPSQ
jgi:hypothetical protein